MDRENNDLENDSIVRLEKNDSSYSSDEKLSVFSSFITMLHKRVEKETPVHDDPIHEIQVFKRIEKILEFYLQKMQRGSTVTDNNLHFTGNLLVNKNHQEAAFIVNSLNSSLVQKELNVMEIDVENILVNFKEFVPVQDAFFEYITYTQSIIVLLRNFSLLFKPTSATVQEPSLENLVVKFLSFLKNKEISKEKVIVLAFIDSLEGVEPSLLSVFDYHVDVNQPGREDREFYLKYLFINEINVNFSVISKEMENWTWNDIGSFAKHVVLEQSMNAIEKLSTKFFLDLLFGENNFGKFIPPSKKLKGRLLEQDLIETAISRSIEAQSQATVPNAMHPPPREDAKSRMEDPFKEQLWQVAASKDYDAIVKALDNLEKGVIEEEDRVLFSRYPFIIMEEPFDAKKKMDASKRKLELINKNFKTGSKK